MVTITLPIGHPCNQTDQMVVEDYWIPVTPSGRAYIRMGWTNVTALVGRRGDVLKATPDTLLATIRAEHQARMAVARKDSEA